MNLTPSSKSSFIVGVGLWCLLWALLFKTDDLAEAFGFQLIVSSDRCLRWINNHKSTSLLATELINFGTHGISDPLGVTFALGGTLVNFLMIYVFLPLRERLKRSSTVHMQL